MARLYAKKKEGKKLDPAYSHYIHVAVEYVLYQILFLNGIIGLFCFHFYFIPIRLLLLAFLLIYLL